MTVRLLIVDDSTVVRRLLSRELAKDPQIEVVDTAADAYEASEKIERLRPDVMTLDVELPRMNGLTFLRGLMKHYPMPVVVVSAHTAKGSRRAMEALDYGAVEVVPKPSGTYGLQQMAGELAAKIKGAARARMAQHRRYTTPATGSTLQRVSNNAGDNRIIVMGGSTGATQAFQVILSRLPENMPPILVVQHMPAGFTKAFAQRLDQLSALTVREAEAGEPLLPGHALIAPGGYHLAMKRAGGRLVTDVHDGPKVCRQRPAADVLFHSAAQLAGSSTIGVILTGMGADGAEGMLAMHQAGAVTVAQDEASSVVFGMPREAIRMGGVDHVVGLDDIPETLHRLLEQDSPRGQAVAGG